MKTIGFTDFCKKASLCLTEVEQGELFVLLRRGKPAAVIRPFSERPRTPSWKQPGIRLEINGKRF